MSSTSGETWKTRPVHTAMRVVAEEFGMEPHALRWRAGRRARAWPRQLVMWLSVELGASFKHTGYYMGGYDHTTVAHSRAKVGRRRAEEPAVVELCKRLVRRAAEISGALADDFRRTSAGNPAIRNDQNPEQAIGVVL